ncbi:MAG: DUF1919 domain-containing protein [Lentisphaeria bacterium]
MLNDIEGFALVIMLKTWYIKLIAKFWIMLRRVRLVNRDFSILSNDCIGGVITHQLGCQFWSPTVNLFFQELEEYVTWCEHLEAYRGIELREVAGIGSPGYPVGELVHPEFGKITLHFLHYKAFAEAKAGWNRRYARLNPDNLFGIIHVTKHQDDLPILLRRFSQLPFRGKLLVTYPGILDENCFWEDSFFIHPNLSTYIHERILHNKNRLIRRRYIDDFDYVHWLNGNIGRR